MVIGKSEWFTRRKYAGWGLYPKSWQGWVYIGVFVAIFFAVQYLPFDAITRLIITGVIGAILVIDVIFMMSKLKKDEREKIHEAIAERNALWGIITVLAIAVGYQVASSTASGEVEFDIWIVIAVVAGLLIKAITNIYLDKKD
jgi:hypothetical protein